MKDAKPYSIDLETDKVKFLHDVVAKHALPDMGKAIRCLVNYARENPEKHREIFDQERCLDC
jgi:hypothetical protein